MSAGKEIITRSFFEPLHYGTEERMMGRTESQVIKSLFGPPPFCFLGFVLSQMPKFLNHIFE